MGDKREADSQKHQKKNPAESGVKGRGVGGNAFPPGTKRTATGVGSSPQSLHRPPLRRRNLRWGVRIIYTINYVSDWEPAMATPEELEEFARDCVRLAGHAETSELRGKLLNLAREWMQAAIKDGMREAVERKLES
jgi:hypothetical protein